MTREQRDALLTQQRIAEAVIVVVNDTPQGATADQLYAPLQSYISREELATMLRSLVLAERISRRGDRYFPKGEPR